MNYNYYEQREVREQLRTYLKALREQAQQENHGKSNPLKKVIFTEPRRGFYHNQYVNRLVLFLRGTGCSLARETGGCTFCGFYNATNFGVKVTDNDYLAQIRNVMEDQELNFEQYPIICLYNDGSMLREEEIGFHTLITILKMLDSKETVKKIVIESRVEDITEDKLKKMKEATTKELEIAVGFESANPLIRDICVNKNFDNNIFVTNCRLTKEYGVSLVPLIILKPPFLSEAEAIEDYVKSLAYVEQFNLQRVDMELPTVETHTLVYDLWREGMYRPAWLWSVIEVLQRRERLGLKTPIYISPMIYSVAAVIKASNCPQCDEEIYEAFEAYNVSGDVEIFEGIDCSCKSEWEDGFINDWEEGLPQRVTEALEQLTQIHHIANVEK